MASVRAPLVLGDRVPLTEAVELPPWVRRLPRGLWLALGCLLIPGYASRWL